MIEILSRRTANSKCFDLGGRQRRTVVSAGALHYRDAVGSWQDIDAGYQEADIGAFTARFTKLPYLVRVGDDSYRRIYPDRNDLSYWLDIGKPFPSMGAPVKIGNTWTWDFAHASLSVMIGRDMVKLSALLKDSQAPTSLTFPFQSEGLTRTGGRLLHNGKQVAVLTRPYAIDANGVERDLDVTWGAGTVTISLDTTGLTYPILVDPTLNVAASNQDAYFAHSDGTGWSIVATTGYFGRNYSQFPGVGFYFAGANIPTGSTIDSAYVTMKSVGNYSNVCNADIFVENATNPAVFSTWADFAARTWTAQVDWDGVESWTAAAFHNTPSLVTPMQAVIDTKAMDEIVVKIQGLTSTSSEGLRRMFMIDSSDGTKVPASLTITWTEGGGGDATVNAVTMTTSSALMQAPTVAANFSVTAVTATSSSALMQVPTLTAMVNVLAVTATTSSALVQVPTVTTALTISAVTSTATGYVAVPNVAANLSISGVTSTATGASNVPTITSSLTISPPTARAQHPEHWATVIANSVLAGAVSEANGGSNAPTVAGHLSRTVEVINIRIPRQDPSVTASSSLNAVTALGTSEASSSAFGEGKIVDGVTGTGTGAMANPTLTATPIEIDVPLMTASAFIREAPLVGNGENSWRMGKKMASAGVAETGNMGWKR